METPKACGVCLAPGDAVNHIDHLAVIAAIMDVPIVVDEELLLETLKHYYPQVKPIYIDHHAKILEYLAKHYDHLFVSAANYRDHLSPLFEVIFQKKMHFWYCPHGNSDKPLSHFGQNNFFLIYGDQMKRRLDQEGFLEKSSRYVITSNYRFSFYHKHQEFYDALVNEEVFKKFKRKQTTILYAPTWHDLEASSSFFDIGLPIAEQLPDEYNLIVKIHPWLDHHHAGHVQALKEKYQDKENIVILSLYPLVLPILKRTDIYLGDFSSIGYDFLYYNRPMFFFESSSRDKSREISNDLHNCGIYIPETAHNKIYPFIEEHLKRQESFSTRRRKVYQDAFGESRSFEDIRNDVLKTQESLQNMRESLGPIRE